MLPVFGPINNSKNAYSEEVSSFFISVNVYLCYVYITAAVLGERLLGSMQRKGRFHEELDIPKFKN